MADDGERPGSASEIAGRIADHDAGAPSKHTERLRFQWNVPEGKPPFIPLWLSLVFLGGLAFAIVIALLPD